MKPGYKTTEFWLSLAALLVGAVFASGILDETATDLDNRLFGLAASLLAALGYTVARAFNKSSEVKAFAEASKQDPTRP